MASAEPPSALIVIVTAPSEEVAARLARGLVEARLAACVNILPGLTSVYRWEGAVESAAEHLLLIKCAAAAYDAVEAWVVAHHPYELPECVALPIVAASSPYLAWLLGEEPGA